MKMIAQIDEKTGFVHAVVNMAEPIPAAPPDRVFVEVDDYDKCGKWSYDGEYHDKPKQP